MTEQREQLILEVGSEGGSIKLLGVETDGTWVFKVATDESALLDDDDYVLPERPWVTSWEEALEQLGGYPWTRLYPLFIHPAFDKKVEAALKRKAGSDGKKEWRRWQSQLLR